MARGTLAILGSGEIAPNMVKVYRAILERLPERHGVMLDSPFGFQENVPQLTAKIVDYFSTSLQFELSPASMLSFENATELQRARFLDQVANAPFVFAGPGSPSYAMRQWGPLNVASTLNHVLDADGVISFSSAAAVTLGKFTAPIYELYKVGDAPFWVDGLNLLARLGLDCVVIPHFDNAEGGNHDTRFCYLGERRLRTLEAMLDANTATLGIDEHTAVVIDLAADELTVMGRGFAHWRIGATSEPLPKGSAVPLDELRNAVPTSVAASVLGGDETRDDVETLGESAARGGEDGLRALAQLVRLASTGGAGRIDPAPLVEGVLAARAAARGAGQYAIADALRDALVDAGVEVHDAPEGVSWSIRES